MKIELILLGVIGLVFLVDFIMNSRKKPSIDNVVDQIDGEQPVKNQSGNTKFSKFILIFTVLVNILITLWIILFEDADFLQTINDSDGQLIEINDLAITYSFLYIINLFLFPLFLYNINFDYILKRKKNLSLSIILILFSKLLAHFFVYTTILNNGGKKPIIGRVFRLKRGETQYREYEAPLSYHIDNIFNEEIWLFIPVTILVIFIAWYFNDKIKAR